MSNPFIKYDSISDIKVNNKKPFLGNISIGILYIPDLENRLNNISGASNLDDLLDVVILNSTNNQGLIYNTTSSKWENQTIDHVNLSNKGSNTHAQIDTFISSKGQASGIASLDSSSKINLNQIQSIALTSVNVVNTIVLRDLLTVETGDVCIVTADPISSNNQSYIYNGSSWSTLSTYIQPKNLSSLTDIALSNIANGNILKYNSSSSKWINSVDVDNLLYSTIRPKR